MLLRFTTMLLREFVLGDFVLNPSRPLKGVRFGLGFAVGGSYLSPVLFAPGLKAGLKGLFFLPCERREWRFFRDSLSRRLKGSFEYEPTESRPRQLDSRFYIRRSDLRLACSDVKLGVMICCYTFRALLAPVIGA